MSISVEIGSQQKRVREQGVTQQDGHAIAPFGIGCWDLAASVSAINDVIMNQCRHVDELKNNPDGEVVGFYAAGSATHKNGQDRADPFAAGAADIVDVRGDGGIEGTYLIANLSLYIFELLLDQFEWYFRASNLA